MQTSQYSQRRTSEFSRYIKVRIILIMLNKKSRHVPGYAPGTSPASPLDLKPVNHRARYVKTGAQNPCGLCRIHVALPAYPLTSGHAQNVVQFSSSVVSFDRMELSCVVGDAVTVTGATSAVLTAEDE